jgi:Zn finger protein HypA/HybF involved in hydrogenase expression
MHELSLVEAILESLIPMCSEYGIEGKVKKVRLRIGRMRQVIPMSCVSRMEWRPKTRFSGVGARTVARSVASFMPDVRRGVAGRRSIAFLCPKCGKERKNSVRHGTRNRIHGGGAV